MNKPVLLVVDDDPQVLAAVRRDLRSRYRERYTVMSAASGQEALATARELKSRGDSLAMLISDQRMPGMLGSEVLARSREVYPLARRVLLTAYSDIEAAVKAINEAHLDHYLSKPWDPPEERLFPVIDDLLDAWQAEYLPEAKGLRLVGHQWSPRSHAIKDFLASNLIPYRWLDVTRDPDARALLDAAGVGADELPALFFDDGGAVLRNPEPRQVAERLGRPLSAAFDVYDLVIVGAGPAGLAAAVYGASEGLRTLLLDRHAPGGQAGTSSRIENYLGFPAGVSGSELTRRALTQAQRLGAEFLAPLEVTRVSIDGGIQAPHARRRPRDRHASHAGRHRHALSRASRAGDGGAYGRGGVLRRRDHGSTGDRRPARARRRRRELGGPGRHVSGAPRAKRCRSWCAAMACAIRCRSTSSIRSRRRRTSGCGPGRKSSGSRAKVTWNGSRSLHWTMDLCRVEEVDALFVFIGTRPRSDWLPATVLRDAKGFVLTGRDLMAAEAYARVWKESREPLPLETSVPGVFAAGDLRAGAMNRVASAVGEGSMVVRLVHEYLALT